MQEMPKELLNMDLPPEFRLMEDEDFVYLFYVEEEIASFSSIGVDPKIIESVANAYQASLQINEGKGGNQ
ncbi:MAG: hypothetical protein AB1480_03910 [Nitrospirota bacterium]